MELFFFLEDERIGFRNEYMSHFPGLNCFFLIMVLVFPCFNCLGFLFRSCYLHRLSKIVFKAGSNLGFELCHSRGRKFAPDSLSPLPFSRIKRVLTFAGNCFSGCGLKKPKYRMERLPVKSPPGKRESVSDHKFGLLSCSQL